MTLIEMIDTARFLLNEDLDSTRTYPDDSSSFFKDTTLQRYANIIQDEVQQVMIETYEDYFVTSTFLSIESGSANYSLPSGTIKVRRVEDARDDEPIEIKPVTINSKKSYSLDITSAVIRGGGYYIKGNEIVFTNTPSFTNSAAIRVYYVARAAEMTAASAISEVPVEHHATIAWGITKMGLYQQNSDATRAEIEYEKRLNRLRKFAENRQIQRSRTVKSIYGDDD